MFRNIETNVYLCINKFNNNVEEQSESSIFGGSSFIH